MPAALDNRPGLSTDRTVAHAFARLRMRLLRNHAQAILSASRLRLATLLICSAIFWVGLFSLFFEGFQFLRSFVNATNVIIELLFSMFFLSLLILLVFSTGIIVYTSLFHSRESAFLLTTPASADRIFAYKFVEALAFSSWGFLLLGSPMMVAYGITVGVGWPFYFLFLAYLLAFVLIPGSIGAIAAMMIANFVPRRARTILAVMGVAVVAAGSLITFRMLNTRGDARDWLDTLLSQLAFAQSPLLPNYWMSKGLVGAARGDWDAGRLYLVVLAAHAGLSYLIAAVVARDLYKRGYNRVQGGRSSRRRIGWHWFDALVHRLLFVFPRPIRLLILKDLRTFRRDPAQWSQFLIFFGLLAFYFINIRRLGYHVQSPYWRSMLSFLNLGVTALILSTFTSRFIFPLLSLEGRNFWILGLLPLRRESILWGKFFFASGISLVVTESLVILSDLMLRVGPLMLAVHVVLVAILCFGLSGISVGLGARLPNLKEDDPSKIATGFGGTLNLLVSLVFILIVVAALALPCQVYFSAIGTNEEYIVSASIRRLREWLAISIAVSIVVGAIATFVPLRIGIKAFQRMEF